MGHYPRTLPHKSASERVDKLEFTVRPTPYADSVAGLTVGETLAKAPELTFSGTKISPGSHAGLHAVLDTRMAPRLSGAPCILMAVLINQRSPEPANAFGTGRQMVQLISREQRSSKFSGQLADLRFYGLRSPRPPRQARRQVRGSTRGDILDLDGSARAQSRRGCCEAMCCLGPRKAAPTSRSGPERLPNRLSEPLAPTPAAAASALPNRVTRVGCLWRHGKGTRSLRFMEREYSSPRGERAKASGLWVTAIRRASWRRRRDWSLRRKIFELYEMGDES